ncbi:hypothetical protein HOU65_gp019 [Salmonella phage Seafire]|uniref:Uncharacterized protein n=1 Tax=Salmonella phage Seafire TaxID=2483612 RepID=A0A3G8F1N3_9CAUD|nr:hypothetical protein HOU65_gp019 [Salmonella phage Seafire]AZF87908.1 hypothetical protein CPT_Seafire_019 [Salmonella phage Seafire]
MTLVSLEITVGFAHYVSRNLWSDLHIDRSLQSF